MFAGIRHDAMEREGRAAWPGMVAQYDACLIALTAVGCLTDLADAI